MQSYLVRSALLSAMVASTAAFTLCPSAPVRGVPAQRPGSVCRLRGALNRRVSLRMEDGGAGDKGGESEEESPAERLFRLSREGRAPLGIEDTIEGIRQARYVSEEPDAGRGVNDRVGLQKRVPGEEDGGGFVLPGGPRSGRQQIMDEEARALAGPLAGVPQDLQFAGAIAGVLAIFFVYTNLSGGNILGSYNNEGGRPGVVERYEEAFVCYDNPTPNDPTGCRNARSVGPVRVFSPAPPPGSAQAAPGTL
ncbi:hypothetical protein T484DRAFT_1928923 [Baffinella frigidus]|nr:hypothetical protein T484DRAFT_1928923 [Cryptophyta sp. CCMP2293]|eukprot:CAMPEP_0180298726 /NCGR_PEP_ID=MMETSP0988-20121125/21547_1 /TAXON_ID=697907 /ORGANISM="non described non described, Strain CCMP2293" /LENGTH=250 /DNA_ID=CAMNT_0022278113 /DNA_START=14 /DNA_END=766 /DNA_ORIENTATION=+